MARSSRKQHKEQPLAGWSVCVLGLHQGLWKWAGCLSANAPVNGSFSTLGDAVHSSFEPEMAAAVHALALCVHAGVPAMLGYDNTSAIEVVTGRATPAENTALAEAGIALTQLLRAQGRMPALLHVASHKGHLLNDAADAIAKHAAKAQHFGRLSEVLYEASDQQVLPWLTVAYGLVKGMPCTDDHGHVHDIAQPTPHRSLSTAVDFNVVRQPRETSFSFSIATYNALTLATQLQRESIDFQLHKAKISVCGIQEARWDPLPRSSTVHYHVLSGPSCQGQEGCQVWLAKNIPVASDSEGPIYWNPQSFSILWSSPRCVMVSASAATVHFAFVSAHALTSKATEEQITQWWQELGVVLRRAPAHHIPVVLIDANAHFAWSPSQPSEDTAQNDNARAMAQLLRQHQLVATPNVTTDGFKVESWTGPLQSCNCLDFIFFPASLSAGVDARGLIRPFHGQCDHDHRPVHADFCFQRLARRPHNRPKWDVRAMATAQGREKIRRIYDDMPPIPWQLDIDSHLEAINQHLHTSLTEHFPAPAARPRSPTIQTETWALVRERRATRRELYQSAQAGHRRLLQCIFSVWKGAPEPLQDHCQCLHEGLIVLHLRGLNRAIRRRAREDATQASRRIIATARAKGPEELFHAFRQVLRMGRRYKQPALCPCIKDPEGKEEDSMLLLGRSFAKAERAVQIRPEELCNTVLPESQSCLPVCPELTLATLARGYGDLQLRRAPGLTGLPPEAYQLDPVGAAQAHLPLLTKIQLRGYAPALWRGGKAAAIPKPNKSPQSLEGWRSIILHEASVKGVCKALRRPLLDCLERVRTAGQCGGRPHNPLQIPMALARGFAKALHATSLNGGLLFVDCRTAFYSTARQALTGNETGQTSAFIDTLAGELFSEPEDRLRFVAQTVGPGLLCQHNVPPAVRRVISAMLDNTWFSIAGDSSAHVFQTRTGTAPGSPVADLEFQIIFAGAMAQMEQRVQEVGRQAQFKAHQTTSAAQLLQVPHPSWMDDLAIPLVAPTPAAFISVAQVAIQELTVQLKPLGIRLNLDHGKTELLPFLRGPGSRQIRRLWLCERGAALTVDLPDHSAVTVGLTETYIHLGSTITSHADDGPDIARRAQLTREMIGPLKRLYRNAELLEAEKVLLLKSMPMKRFIHGAGLWSLDTTAEKKKFTAAFYEAPRRLLRAITGMSVRGLTNRDVAMMLDIATAEETRHAEVLRAFAWMQDEGQDSLLALWRNNKSWWEQVQVAMAAFARTLEKPIADIEAVFYAQPQSAKQLIKRYLKCNRVARAKEKPRRELQLRNLQQLTALGVHFGHCPDLPDTTTDPVACPVCSQVFLTSAACGSHMRKVHDMASRATRVAEGTACQVCSTEFWHIARLRQHLSRSSTCLAALEAADLAPAIASGGSSKAWRPATKFCGPIPWWATRRPPLLHEASPPKCSAWKALLRQLLTNCSGHPQAVRSTLGSIVALKAFQNLDTDEMPVDFLRHSVKIRSLVEVLIWICNLADVQSTSTFRTETWHAHVRHGRFVVWPLDVPHAVDGDALALPTEWASCLS